MSFEVIATDPFERKLKRLAKKHKSIALDLASIFEELEENPTLGVYLGKNCYKIRVAISSKGKGKSGGARIITYVRVVKNTVFLMDIFDKTEQSTITDKEIQMLINSIAEDDN